jgi:transcriptional antiterminator RfaH
MTCHTRGTSWFLAQCKPNSHRIADRNLTRQGFRTFVPLQEQTRRAHGRFVTRTALLFPGYLFVAFDTQRVRWQAVNATSGITRLVSFGRTPAPVPLDLISQLMLRCDRDGKLMPPRLVAAGDTVTVTHGPFAEFVATVECLAPDRRVWVLLDIMGSESRVAVPAGHLQSH